MLRKLPMIGVFGQGSAIASERAALARAAGALVARLGAHLLTGAGYGVMEAAAQGFTAVPGRAGFSIGIVPRDPAGKLDTPNHDPDGRAYPNAFVEVVIFTALPPRLDHWRNVPARNHVNVLSVDAAIVLPGNSGTRNELDMLAFYREDASRPKGERRTILLGPADEFDAKHLDFFPRVETPAAAQAHVMRVLAAHGFALPEAVS